MNRQTYENYKLFFSYDESSDNTLNLLKKHKNESEKIIILEHPKRCGMGPARDFVLDSGLLKGKYLICLDIDDVIEEDFLEEMVENAETYNVDVVICGLECFDDLSGKRINVQMINCPDEIITDIREFYEIAYLNCAVWNKLYRRETIKDYRFGSPKHLEDGIYFYRILPSIHSIKFINKVLYHYRVSVDSAQSKVTDRKFEICWDYYRKLVDDCNKNPETYADFRSILELMTFVKCGIGLTCRVALKDLKHMHQYVVYSRNMLDEIVPGWKVNKNLTSKGFTKRRFKENIVALSALLYKIGCFEVLIIIYWLFKKISIKEVRW